MSQDNVSKDLKPRRKATRQKLERPRPVDVHVGGRVRLRRTMLGLSQEKLGDAIGLTFQQIQKYERGTNRMGSSRLWEMSRVLDVPVSFFFDEMGPEVSGTGSVATSMAGSGDGNAATPASELGTLVKRETLELVRAYYRIRSPKVRKRVFDLTKTLSKMDDPES